MNSWGESGLTGSGLQRAIETGSQTRAPPGTLLPPTSVLKMETRIRPHAKSIWSGGNQYGLSPILCPLSS